MTSAVTISFAAAEAHDNEFGYLSHPKPWWEIAMPFAAVGLWLALCGLAAWVVAGRLLKSRSALWSIFATSAFVPLCLFVLLYVAISIVSGAKSISAILLGLASMLPQGFVFLSGMILAGIVAATLRIARHSKLIKNGVQESLDAFE